MSSIENGEPKSLVSNNSASLRADVFAKRQLVLGIAVGVLIFYALVLTTLFFWDVPVWPRPMDYRVFGNWGEVLSGLATTAAVSVALASLIHERSSRAAQERERAIEREAALYLWLTFSEAIDAAGSRVGRIWVLQIQNLTSAPVYRWSVQFQGQFPHLCGFRTRPLLPGENVFNLPFLDNFSPNEIPACAIVFETQSGAVCKRTDRGSLEASDPQSLVCEHWPQSSQSRALP